jgi:hypothetical protein
MRAHLDVKACGLGTAACKSAGVALRRSQTRPTKPAGDQPLLAARRSCQVTTILTTTATTVGPSPTPPTAPESTYCAWSWFLLAPGSVEVRGSICLSSTSIDASADEKNLSTVDSERIDDEVLRSVLHGLDLEEVTLKRD